jgi:hypothetical protein
MGADKRKFGKYWYSYFEGYRLKSQAINKANLWRKKELGARVTKEGAYYVVWVRYDN